jgi:hypothetical protein
MPVPPGDGVIGLPDRAGQHVSFGANTAVCRLISGVCRPKLGRNIVYGQTDIHHSLLEAFIICVTEDPLQNAG